VSAGAVYDFLIAGEHARPADIDVSARRASTLETSGPPLATADWHISRRTAPISRAT